MRKIIVISVAAVLLLCLSACHTSIPNGWNADYDDVIDYDTAPTDTETSPATQAKVLETLADELTDEYDYYHQVADKIAAAFVNGDTGYLSTTFKDESGRGFDFIKELSFIEFVQVDRGVKYIEYEGHTYVTAVVYYYYITVDGAGDDVFTAGGREWELRLMTDEDRIVQQFSPAGKLIGEGSFQIELPYDFEALYCYYISNDLNIFESISNFNLLTSSPGRYSDSNSHMEWIYYKLVICLCRIDGYYGGYTIDEFTERVERLFGINNIDKSLVLEFMDSMGYIAFGSTGHGWHWHYAGLVSTEITGPGDGNAIEVVVDYYGDTGGFLLAKTMKYTFAIGHGVSRLISIECVYSDDDLILAMGTS